MDVYTIAEDLTQNTSAKDRRKARRKARAQKIKAGFKKFGRGLATVFLAPARGAFYAYVALNINGIANQLKWIFENEKGKASQEAKSIRKKLKDIGVRKFGTLMKSIKTGAKKKPFFFSKKARRKLTAQAAAKGFKARGVNGIEYISEPATTATIIASSAAVVGAIIPIILKAMDKKGDPAAAQQAVDTAQQTSDQLKEDPAVVQQAAQAPAADQGESEAVEGIGKLDPRVTSALFAGLNTLTTAGLQIAQKKIEQRAAKDPKLRNVLQKGNEAVENYAAGAYLRRAGAIDDAKNIATTYGGLTKFIIPAAVVGGVLLFTMRKK